MRRPLIAANWKMNASLNSLNQWLDGTLEHTDLSVDRLLIPAFPYIYLAAEKIKGKPSWFVGGQNCAQDPKGAFTGEVSPEMLKDVGASYVLIGHSERRQQHAEGNELVLQKTKLAIASGLNVIVCVGETACERQQNIQERVLSEQLGLLTSQLGEQDWQKLVIAYEPVWAIGSGESATPEQAQEVHRYIRNLLRSVSDEVSQQAKIIYGGSVNANNAQSLFAQADIDGALIGGASLEASSFIEICKLAG